MCSIKIKKPDFETRREMVKEIRKTIIGLAIASVVTGAGIAIADHYAIAQLVQASEGHVGQDEFGEVKDDIKDIKTDVREIRQHLLNK